MEAPGHGMAISCIGGRPNPDICGGGGGGGGRGGGGGGVVELEMVPAVATHLIRGLVRPASIVRLYW